MRYAILSLLFFALLAGCNRDAANPAAPDGSFLSPAEQPETVRMSSKAEDTRPLEGTKMIDGSGEEAIMENGKKVEPRLTEEDLADARRSGSRRPGSSDKQAPISGTATPQPDNPATMPAPANSGKPVLEYDRPVFAISKTPCYGDCEQYSLTLTNDRQLILDAKKNMDKKGTYRIRLNAREYNALLSGLDSLNLDQLPPVFPRNIKMIPADAPATVLRFPEYTGATEMKKVEVYSDAPEKLASFLQRFEALVKRKDWVAVKP